MTFETFSEVNGVLCGRRSDKFGSSYVVADSNFRNFRLTFDISRDRTRYCINIDAEWNDDHPGELANIIQGDKYFSFSPDDAVSIADDGVLTAWARERIIKTGVDIRSGFTARLPPEFVMPVRQALERIKADLQTKPEGNHT